MVMPKATASRKAGLKGAEKRSRRECVFYVSAALMSMGVLVYLWTRDWAYRYTGDGLSMAAFPTIFAAGLLIACIVGLVTGKGRKESSASPPPSSDDVSSSLWPSVLLSGSVIVSTVGIWYFDAVVTCTLLVLFLLLVGRVRDWRVLGGVSLGTGLLIYVLFVLVLGVFFPHGWFN